jgi:hypothetical protein
MDDFPPLTLPGVDDSVKIARYFQQIVGVPPFDTPTDFLDAIIPHVSPI